MQLPAVLLVFFCLLPGLTNSEVFSSVADMQAVFQLERSLVNILLDYASKLQGKLSRIKKYVSEFESVLHEGAGARNQEELTERLVGNPIHAYNLIRRFSIDVGNIERDIQEDDWAASSVAVQKLRLGSVAPKESDLHGAAQALIRLQDVYELDISALAEGKIGRRQTRARLSAQDCLFMGKHCYNGGVLSRSIEWFEEAWMLAGEEENSTVSQDQVKQFLDHAAKEHDERVLKGESSGNLFPRPVYEEPPQEQRSNMLRSRRKMVARNVSDLSRMDQTDDAFNFAALCRGEEMRAQALISSLSCWFDSRNEPWLMLQPVRVELVHRQPDIWLFHDVISGWELKDIMETAKPHLARSQVMAGERGGASAISTTRTSKTGWLGDDAHPTVRSLGKRIGLITGLATDTDKDDAELLQVANYMNGGHYNPHHDYVMKEKAPDHLIYLPESSLYIGDRVATWMFYMSDVGEGGRTVFPRVGAGVQPKAGSAVFWYNVRPNGKADTLTLHGACPVLYGTKWVANKWIREGAQIWRRPCPLFKD